MLGHLDHRVIDRILVLIQPAGDIVRHNPGIVGDGKVGPRVGLRLGFQEDGQLAQGGLQLLLKGLVSGLWEEGLLFEDGPDAHGLLEHDDGSGEVHPEVHHHPVDTLFDILFLLDNEPKFINDSLL